MKKLLFCILLMLLPILANAYDIEVVNTDGKKIYYNWINDGKELEVTHNQINWNSYSGDVVIPETVLYEGNEYHVTSIGGRAFNECSLTSITIPNSVTSIGGSAFERCSLTSITIPNSVTTIGQYAFDGCYALKFVHITDLEDWCKISFKDYYANPLCCAQHLYLNGEEIKDLFIPNGVTSIGQYAFCRCTGLTSVNFGNSVTSICSSAFSGCTGLTSVNFGNSVESIGNSAFADCQALTSLVIPNSVTSIGNGAFQYCEGLTSVVIPSSVTTISEINYENPFEKCDAITSVTIGTERVGAWFSGIKKLENIQLEESVKVICENAFNGCSGLKTIELPRSITKIESKGFAGLEYLTDVTCYADIVPETARSAFEGSYPDYVNLHVPEASIDAYKATAPWDGFKTTDAAPNKIPADAEQCAQPTISFNEGVLSFSCDTPDVTYYYNIIDANIHHSSGNDIRLNTKYKITVFAAKEGFKDSEVTTQEIQFEGILNGDVDGNGIVNVADHVKLSDIIMNK